MSHCGKIQLCLLVADIMIYVIVDIHHYVYVVLLMSVYDLCRAFDAFIALYNPKICHALIDCIHVYFISTLTIIISVRGQIASYNQK